MVAFGLFVWVAILLLAVWCAHWGADQLATPLEKLRREFGLTAAAGGAVIGLASASPEIGIAIVSAVRGISDLGLGNLLGATIVSIPLIVTTAYAASRSELDGSDDQEGSGNQNGSGDQDGETSEDADTESHPSHSRHLQAHLIHVDRNALTVLLLPYLGLIALFAAVTLPAGWRGLQPLDSAIMLAAYVAFLGQAVFRQRSSPEQVSWTRREALTVVAGFVALALGAYVTVRSMEHILEFVPVSPLIGGLFITGTVSTAPEVFAAWSVVRNGQVTSGTTSVIADNVVTLSLALVPLGLVTVPILNFDLFATNLLFVGIFPAMYSVFLYESGDMSGLSIRDVAAFDLTYGVYVAVVLFWVL